MPDEPCSNRSKTSTGEHRSNRRRAGRFRSSACDSNHHTAYCGLRQERPCIVRGRSWVRASGGYLIRLISIVTSPAPSPTLSPFSPERAAGGMTAFGRFCSLPDGGALCSGLVVPDVAVLLCATAIAG